MLIEDLTELFSKEASENDWLEDDTKTVDGDGFEFLRQDWRKGDTSCSSGEMESMSLINITIVTDTNIQNTFSSNQTKRSTKKVHCEETDSCAATKGVETRNFCEACFRDRKESSSKMMISRKRREEGVTDHDSKIVLIFPITFCVIIKIGVLCMKTIMMKRLSWWQ